MKFHTDERNIRDDNKDTGPEMETETEMEPAWQRSLEHPYTRHCYKSIESWMRNTARKRNATEAYTTNGKIIEQNNNLPFILKCYKHHRFQFDTLWNRKTWPILKMCAPRIYRIRTVCVRAHIQMMPFVIDPWPPFPPSSCPPSSKEFHMHSGLCMCVMLYVFNQKYVKSPWFSLHSMQCTRINATNLNTQQQQISSCVAALSSIKAPFALRSFFSLFILHPFHAFPCYKMKIIWICNY